MQARTIDGRDVLLCVKCGGHNIARLAAADGALLLGLSPVRGAGAWLTSTGGVAAAD